MAEDARARLTAGALRGWATWGRSTRWHLIRDEPGRTRDLVESGRVVRVVLLPRMSLCGESVYTRIEIEEHFTRYPVKYPLSAAGQRPNLDDDRKLCASCARSKLIGIALQREVPAEEWEDAGARMLGLLDRLRPPAVFLGIGELASPSGVALPESPETRR